MRAPGTACPVSLKPKTALKNILIENNGKDQHPLRASGHLLPDAQASAEPLSSPPTSLQLSPCAPWAPRLAWAVISPVSLSGKGTGDTSLMAEAQGSNEEAPSPGCRRHPGERGVVQ